MRDYIIQIKKALGSGNNCLGGYYYFDFLDKELDEFLQNMSSVDRDNFNELVCNYYIYMESLSLLRSYKIKPEDSIVKSFYYNAWSNIALSIMFSLIERITLKSQQIPFVNFLKNNFKRIKTPEDIKTLSKEHKKLNNSIVDSIFSFYTDNLSERDKEKIEKCFNTDFRRIVKDILYGKIRTNLVHSLNIESLPQNEAGFSEEGNIIELSNELNTERFIYLSWKAIFKYFGYSKDL